MLGAEKIEKILAELCERTDVRNYRLHTRSIVYAPELINQEIIKVLSKYNVRTVFHVIHPYEICNIVEKKVTEIVQAGVRCYNQFPLLRGINDHIMVITKLLEILDQNRIRNLSIFVTDPLNSIEEYRVSIRRSFEMWTELELCYPSWLNSTKMVFDSQIGKVHIKDIIMYDEEKEGYWFARGKEKIFFKDIPSDKEKPGVLTEMLWKERRM